MNKRNLLLNYMESTGYQDYIPAGFFIHFDDHFHSGKAAVARHLEYFNYTNMDFIKVQFEQTFPQMPKITTPDDWEKIPTFSVDTYAGQLQVIEGLIKEVRSEALIVVTLYSPFMCMRVATSNELVTEHFTLDPETMKKALEVMTESLLQFVRACIKLGVDGFYTSTQGAEANRFDDKSIFKQYIKPSDLVVMKEIEQACIFNILHICDYRGGYDDLQPFIDYPGHVVNCSQQVGAKKIGKKELSQLFSRPFMVGMDRHGVISTGRKTAIVEDVKNTIKDAPKQFILGADCTLPNDIDWDCIRLAIETSHSHTRQK
ncbi:MAG: hypothetical protein H8E38_07735 [SAR324 cluster bacterium]|nr:hypothetical protein [SAR324 cluster bacterium]MBL7034552.1 hypothetical protein [SAR324 cluster bacterium]